MAKKPKIVFAFVEAGMGHIMPMTAVYNAFVKKYGDKCEVVKSYFFRDKDNPDMKYVEEEFIREVKLTNACRARGSFQFFLLDLLGYNISMKFVLERKFKRGYKPSIEYMKELNPDLIFNTHFSTLYYACQAKSKGLINPDIVAYCPDPRIGGQWDTRLDLIAVSSSLGKQNAERKKFKKGQVVEVPFMIRQEVKNYDKDKKFYRRELGIPEDNFTILLADGAYGAGKLRETVYKLFGLKQKITVLAVCGKNERLYREFCAVKKPENICFVPFGFTDKMLMLSACCDVFIGKAGASNMAEACYFGAPQIVTFCATPIETWIAEYYTDEVKSAVKITDINKVVKKIDEWISRPESMQPYIDACKSQHRTDGPDMMADILWDRLSKRYS